MRQRYKGVMSVDIDGVLANFSKGFLTWLNDSLGLSLKESDVKRYYWHECCDELTEEQFFEEFHKFGHAGGYLHLDILPGALEMLDELDKARYEILYVTNRPDYLYDDTVEYFEKHKLPQRHNLIFAGGKKSPILNVRGATAHIDDAAYVIEDVCANTKARGYLLDYLHNQEVGVDNYTRIYSLEELLEHEGVKSVAAK